MTTAQRRVHPVFWVHRIGCVVVALILWAFAILGLLSGAGFFSTHGATVVGMTSNGLLSTMSLVVGAVLVAAAVLGGRAASTTSVVVGALFVLSGLLNLIALVHPNLNVLAFTLPNVVFSLIVGLALQCVGLYGRASGQLPADNPYRQARGGDNPVARLWHGESLAQESTTDQETAQRRIEETTEAAKAEYAFAQGTATPEQERQVLNDAQRRATERRRRAWRQARR
ncbi:MAG TPA: DUF4383 domain-containing protein [Pseudonocardiaceae bacterium]|nr:DUF4383 domain-containing protein [Pseudonocardiaceae bacterium]